MSGTGVMRVRRLAALLLPALCLPAFADEPTATPYRPTVANPAELPVPGWLEVEAGLSRSKGGGAAWRETLPFTFKYAFSPDLGILLGGDLRVWREDFAGSTAAGRGDTNLIVKQRWDAGAASAWGLEWGAKLDTAKAGLGSGHNDYLLTGIYSIDIADVRIDANLGATRLGLVETGLGRWQYGWAVSASTMAASDWTLAAELSGTQRRGQASSTQFLAAASYSLSKRLVLDFGAAAGLDRASPDWTAFAGVTWLVGKK